MLDFSKYYKVPETYEAVGYNSSNPDIHPIFIEGPSYHGKKTRFFAWYGVPENKGKQDKVPGIILLHGALGTAFAPWVKRWNDLGYCAIAIDMFGGLPAEDGSYCSRANPKLHDYSMASFDYKFTDVDEDIENQWVYQAIAATITAGSFLGNLDFVDSSNIGLTGISWGGVIASLTSAFDNRLKFVVPIYSCGGKNPIKLLANDYPASKVEKFISLWNPDNFLKEVDTPVLWINGSNDPFFDLKSWNKTTSLSANSYRTLLPSMVHSQLEGEKPSEISTFADCIIKNKKYPGFLDVKLDSATQHLTGKIDCNEDIVNAQLFYTRSGLCWNDCVFRPITTAIDRKNNNVLGQLPSNWTAAFFTVEIKVGNNIVKSSSEVIFH